MKILIFIEGTILMHAAGEDLEPNEIIEQVKAKHPSVHEYSKYIPIGKAVNKLKGWEEQGAELCYLTSRRNPSEITDIQNVLDKYDFPKGILYFRNDGEEYKDVAERILPDFLIEDDCESIGGEIEMTYPSIRYDIKPKIGSIAVKEFGGIAHLPDDLSIKSKT